MVLEIRGEKDDHTDLGNLRGLCLERSDRDPQLGAVDLCAKDDRRRQEG